MRIPNPARPGVHPIFSVRPRVSPVRQLIERAALGDLGRQMPREALGEWVAAIESALDRGGSLPARMLADPAGRVIARRLGRALLSGVTGQMEACYPDLSEEDVLRILRLVVEMQDQSDEPDEGELDPYGWDTVELAHDIRSPLTSILFLADTLRRGQSGPVSELQHRQLGMIYGATLGLISHANDVIGYAHPGELMVERKPSHFSLRALFDALVDLVKPLADERKLDLRVLIHADDYRIGQPTVLSRILLNLTTNALRYTQKGMVEIVARSLPDERVELSVRDTGPGLDGATLEHLSRPLPAGFGGKRAPLDATGLGLTICRKLTQALDSELRFETAEGWGTRLYFEVHLPAVAAPN